MIQPRFLLAGMCQAWDRFQTLLARPTSGASLAVFRIFFGLIMAWYAISLLLPQANGTTLVERYYAGVMWNFPYAGFEWVRAWPEPWMSLHVVLIAGAGIAVALGLFYRTAAVALFLSFTYLFLLEESRYNNHYYLMSILAFLLIWMPAQARWSIDRWRARRWRAAEEPAATTTIPFWPVFLLRAQLFIMYFYGGIAKIDADWLTGMPMLYPGGRLRTLLESFVSLPDLVGQRELCLFLAYGGLVFDLAIGFLLLFRRTRILGLLLTITFHTINHHLFPIGVFPFLATAGSLIFLEPDWPVRLWNWLRRPRWARPDLGWLVGGALAVPVVGAALGWRLAPSQSSAGPSQRSRLALGFVCIWLAVQVLLPFRHYAIDGNAAWTEEAHMFSWRMMLRSKSAVDLLFMLEDPAVVSFDAESKPIINMANWPAGLPATRYMAIECFQTDWRQLPPLLVIHEPCLGERIIYNPHSTKGSTDRSLSGCQLWVICRWQHMFGRTPGVRPTVSLTEALADLEREVQASPAPAIALQRQYLLDGVRVVGQLARQVADPNEKKDPKLIAELAMNLHRLNDSDVGPLLKRHLRQSHPFTVQGCMHQTPFLVIDDPAIQNDNRWLELRKLNDGKPHLVFVDLSKTQPAGWKELPLAFFCHLEGKQRILWNYFLELGSVQIRKLATTPYMIHQYAHRIAGVWQTNTGRRPEVHVGAAVRLNHRPPQLLVDPRVDLAAAPYRLFRHNQWIMPLEGRPPTFDERLGGVEECEVPEE